MSTSDQNYSSRLKVQSYDCKRYCCVPQCNKKYVRGNNTISFHAFPNDKQKKRQWEIVLKMGRKIPKYAVVCSTHFQETDFISSQKDQLPRKLRRLKINAIPSLNLPKRKLDKKINTPSKEKIRKKSERAEK